MNQNKTNINLLELIDGIVTRICHDLINPIGTAQMAFEQINFEQPSNTNQDMKNILANCLEQAIERLDLFRTIFRVNVEKDIALELLHNYVKKHNLNVEVYDTTPDPALMFFLIQKMTKQSRIAFYETEVLLEGIRLNDEEIDVLKDNEAREQDMEEDMEEDENLIEGIHNIKRINTGNVLPFIAYLTANLTANLTAQLTGYKMHIKQLDKQNWKIIYKKA